jgi:hypothetical protein
VEVPEGEPPEAISSGVENDLFVDPKTSMLFGDARQSLLDLGLQVKEHSACGRTPLPRRSSLSTDLVPPWNNPYPILCLLPTAGNE